MQDIRTWMNSGRDYDEGAALYQEHGKDPLLKKMFSEPASEFKNKRLHDALKELLTGIRKQTEIISADKVKAIETDAFADKKWPAQRDPVLQALYNKWKPIYAEMMDLCSRMYEVAKAADTYYDSGLKANAGKMAHRILDLDDECDEIYEERDFYLKHKKLPEAPAPVDLVVDPKKIPLALNNAKRYVREYKNKLAKNPNSVDAAKQLSKWQTVVAEYEKQLNL